MSRHACLYVPGLDTETRHQPGRHVAGVQPTHPRRSDDVTTDGLRHIQACRECRARFPYWVHSLDAAEAAEPRYWPKGTQR